LCFATLCTVFWRLQKRVLFLWRGFKAYPITGIFQRKEGNVLYIDGKTETLFTDAKISGSRSHELSTSLCVACHIGYLNGW
jgi:hypothetical protein